MFGGGLVGVKLVPTKISNNRFLVRGLGLIFFWGGIWQMANKLPAGSLEFCQTTIFRNLSPSFWSIAIEALDFGLL